MSDLKVYKVHSGHKRKLISPHIFIAGNFFQRLFGLIFRRPLKGDEVLILKGCKSIHTMGMRYRIDAVFLDRHGRVITIFEDLPPLRSTPFIADAASVLESRSGFVKEKSLAVGDRLVLD